MDTDYIKESLKIEAFLDELLQRKESNEVEFKSAKGGFPGAFWETYSSFANTDGGVVFFVVREKEQTDKEQDAYVANITITQRSKNNYYGNS